MNDDAPLTPTEPIPPAEPSPLHQIFIGKDGLRAGWSLLIFIALFVVFMICANVIGHKLHPPPPRTGEATAETSSGPRVFIGESIPLLVTLLVTWIMSEIEGRPNSVYGLGGRRKLARFLAGLAWGSLFSPSWF